MAETIKKYLNDSFAARWAALILIALAIAATTDEVAARAMAQLPKLRGCEAHTSVIVSAVDKAVYRKLGLNLTCSPVYETKKLYHR